MATKLEALVTCNNNVYSKVNSFKNTFLSSFETMRTELINIGNKALIGGGWASFSILLADIVNQSGSNANSTIMTNTLTQAKDLVILLNAYNPAGTLADRLTKLGAVITKIESMVTTIDRV